MTHRVLHRTAVIGSLTLHVYGLDNVNPSFKEHDYSRRLEQGYYVSKNGRPTPRCELTKQEQADVSSYLQQHHPQHALI